MPLLLPRNYAPRAALQTHGVRCLTRGESAARALRVGIINLMPVAERYEPLLLTALASADALLEPVFIRLRTHTYESSDAEHLDLHYVTYEQASAQQPLAALILTGAPVEELEFDQVRYFAELTTILAHSHAHVGSTLGLCWGGMALAHLLGIEKQSYAHKLFGRFALRPIESAGSNLAGDGPLWCMQSRHAGISDVAIERAVAQGVITPLAHSARTGYSVFQSVDGRYVMHLGHPEYDRARIVFEYRRDVDKGRSDVPAPEGIDVTPMTRSCLATAPDFFRAGSRASHPPQPER